MKRFILGLIIVLGIAVPVYGKIHFDQKVEQTVSEARGETEEEPSGEAPDEEAASEEAPEQAELSDLLEDADSAFAEKMAATIAEGEPLTMVVAGSGSVTAEDGESYAELLRDGLQETYNTDLIEVEVVDFEDQDSLEVLDNDSAEEIAELSPDILLYDPLVLNDNGEVSIEDTVYSLRDTVQTVMNENPDVVPYIQPPQPIFEAEYYLDQINGLNEEMEESEELIYINHWESWPDTTDEDIEEYVDELDVTPAGHELWAEHLLAFFTGEDEVEEDEDE
ncbi:hypothetical protein [Alteribacillus sp. HJP-4]|uniref:hypothetical protein n=1 Tax=Alteribacillus sp. HJP-4 TaxID=2775394 RepID=UPI0035CD15F1